MRTCTKLASFVCVLLFSSVMTTASAFEALVTPQVDNMVLYEDEENTKGEIALGKILFFDNRLSSNYQQNCATCHDPKKGFSDGFAKGFGTQGNRLGRNSPQIYNLGWSSIFMWDGREPTLEDQALGPIKSPAEMNLPIPELLTRLNAVPKYKEMFKTVYDVDEISRTEVGRAIAAFERSIVVDDTAFDKHLAGDTTAISEAAKRGLAVFSGKGNCVLCHDGANFTDDSFHSLGFDDADAGRANVTGDKTQIGAFKTPGLRNIEFSAPYMHNGSLASLEAVVAYYNQGAGAISHTDSLLVPLNLTATDQTDLVAFMKSLSQEVAITMPQIP